MAFPFEYQTPEDYDPGKELEQERSLYIARAVLALIGDPEASREIEEAGLLEYPALVRLLYRVGERLQERPEPWKSKAYDFDAYNPAP